LLEIFSGQMPTLNLRKSSSAPCLDEKGMGISDDSMIKSVSFDRVEVTLFAPCLGDNPSVSSGIPIAMSCDSVHSFSSSIEEYEAETKSLPSAIYQRVGRISAEKRLDIAAESGCSFDDLKSSLRGVRQAKPKNVWNLFHIPSNLKHKKTKKQFLKLSQYPEPSTDSPSLRASHIPSNLQHKMSQSPELSTVITTAPISVLEPQSLRDLSRPQQLEKSKHVSSKSSQFLRRSNRNELQFEMEF